MIEYILAASGALAVLAMIRGPTFADRSLAVGVLMNIAIIFLLLYAVRQGFTLYLDVSVAIIFMSFVGTLAIARYARRRK